MQQGRDQARLIVNGRIVELYAPYVLVRCARYTNGRRQAHQIGVYTLVTACLAAREVGDIMPMGRIVETMLKVIGPDVLAGARGEDWRDGGDEPLLVDPRMRLMATALNALKRPGREVLVLHHVGGRTPEDLARLGRTERRLAAWLGAADVRPLLTRFAAGLDRGWMQEVAAGAMDYLSANATVGGEVKRQR